MSTLLVRPIYKNKVQSLVSPTSIGLFLIQSFEGKDPKNFVETLVKKPSRSYHRLIR